MLTKCKLSKKKYNYCKLFSYSLYETLIQYLKSKFLSYEYIPVQCTVYIHLICIPTKHQNKNVEK